jgi:flagellar hook-length control protein FliK
MSELHITTQLLAGPADASAPQAGAPADPAAGFDFPALLARQLESAPQAQEDAPPAADAAAGEEEAGELRDAFGIPLASAAMSDAPRGAEPAPEEALQLAAAIALGTPPAILPPVAALRTLAPAAAANDARGAPDALAPAGARPGVTLPCGLADGLPGQAAQAPQLAAAPAGSAPAEGADAPRASIASGAPAEPERGELAALAAAAAERAESALRAAAEAPAPRAIEPDHAPVFAEIAPAAPRAPGLEGRAPVLAVPGQLHTALWREELGAAVRVLAVQNIQQAELRVHPPELGPVHVSLRLEGGEATVSFAAPHAETRAALEAALPRLREMLEGAGLSFGGASVDVSDPGQGREREAAPRAPASAYLAPLPAPAAPAAALGLVDVFA